MLRKRIEIWQDYRNQIFNEAAKIDNPLHFDKKWNNYINQLNKIDPAIISSIKFDKLISLPFVFKLNDGIDSSYNNISFDIDNINSINLEKLINKRNRIANEEIKSIFINNDSNELSKDAIKELNDIQNNQMQIIDNKLNDLEINIQNFSKNANDKLKKLNNTINEAKTFSSNNLVKLEFKAVNKTFNFKIMFYVIMILLIIIAIVSIALIIYFLVV